MNRAVLTVVGGGILAVALTGCTRTVVIHDKPTTIAHSAPAVVDTPVPDTFDYNTAGLTIALKVTSKQCFGSAGCNVTVKPELTVADLASVPDTASGTVTYTITGDDSGPVIGTLTITGTQYEGSESDLSTSGSGVVPKAKITDITTDPQ